MAKKPKKSEFHRLRNAVGLGRQEKAKIFLEVSERTLQRWDKEGAPPMAMRLLRYRDRWDCAAHGPEWAGWKFSRGRLVNAREKLIFTPDRLKLWRGMCEKLDRLEAEAANRRACPVMRIIRKITARAAYWMAWQEPERTARHRPSHSDRHQGSRDAAA